MIAARDEIEQDIVPLLMHYQYALLLLIIVFAAALRLYKLGAWSFWIDEIFTINRSQSHYDPLSFFQYWSPISIILEAQALKIGGINEFSSRIVPAIIGVLSLPILYFPVRHFFGVRTALIATLLLAISPWHLFWSQSARFYTMLALLFTLAFFAFLTAFEKNRPLYIVLFFVLFFLALRERTLAVFGLPVALVYPFVLRWLRVVPPPGVRRFTLLILYTPIVIVVLIEIVRYVTSGTLFFAEEVELFLDQAIDDPFRLSFFIVFNLGIPLVVLGLLGGVITIRNKDRGGILMFLIAVLPVLTLVAMSIFGFVKDRYVFMTLPAWIILAAFSIDHLTKQLPARDRILALGILCVLLADAGGNLVQYYQTNNGNRRDWRSAFYLVQERMQPGDNIVASRPEIGNFYLEEEVLWMADVVPETLVDTEDVYWFVIDSESMWAMGTITPWLLDNGQLIERWVLRVPEDISLSVYQYDPRTIR